MDTIIYFIYFLLFYYYLFLLFYYFIIIFNYFIIILLFTIIYFGFYKYSNTFEFVAKNYILRPFLFTMHT